MARSILTQFPLFSELFDGPTCIMLLIGTLILTIALQNNPCKCNKNTTKNHALYSVRVLIKARAHTCRGHKISWCSAVSYVNHLMIRRRKVGHLKGLEEKPGFCSFVIQMPNGEKDGYHATLHINDLELIDW